MAASQSATMSSVMIASLFKPIRTKPVIAALAGCDKAINHTLPLRHFVCVPMWCGLTFS
jgi:hypothetical protein